MFDALSERLQAGLADVRGRGTLTEKEVDAAMPEIRLALLEADVNFRVVKSFTSAVRERALGAGLVVTARTRARADALPAGERRERSSERRGLRAGGGRGVSAFSGRRSGPRWRDCA
jgi:hypothetical protein